MIVRFDEKGNLIPFPYQYMGPMDEQIGGYECLYWYEHALVQRVDERWQIRDIQPLGPNHTYSYAIMFEDSSYDALPWDELEDLLRRRNQSIYLIRFDPHLHNPIYECFATYANYDAFDASGFNPFDTTHNPLWERVP